MDQSTGALEPVGKTTGVTNPSYLAVDPRRRYLYAVNELKMYEGKPSGSVSAFIIDPATGKPELLNRKPTHGTDPCHVVVDKTGRYVIISNFMSGSVCVLPIGEDGSLGDATDFIQHHGSSIDPARQKGPHAHSVILDETNRYVFVPDLGLDQLVIYEFDPEHGKLRPKEERWVRVKPGAGPRHFIFRPDGRYAYLINELDSTCVAFLYDKDNAKLEEIQTVPTLPDGFLGQSTCAGVDVAPSGKYFYGSNRGHDSIVIYRIDQSTGRLSYVGHQSTQGKTPRHFSIDPTGRFLYAANQDTDTIVTFRIDPNTGKLQATGHVTEVPTPVCVLVVPQGDD